ncbi:hypothetical protein MINTMi27_15460 [Mycobacterium intracellulare]|uniref:hypothetical protein n=1 Tax=Mycobacterium intracellulare TaxID=1767 RepID=UPI001927FC83|nr:hypothetical protein [Mycobacterium intracellulare]BCP41453.1 hypothetical protein MINTMi27_15460 [Mycobacterium intracellulare]
MPKIYSREVREHTVKAAQKLLEMSGCMVTYARPAYDRVTLDIHIPPDSDDKAGDLLRAAIADQEANAPTS